MRVGERRDGAHADVSQGQRQGEHRPYGVAVGSHVRAHDDRRGLAQRDRCMVERRLHRVALLEVVFVDAGLAPTPSTSVGGTFESAWVMRSPSSMLGSM